MQERKVKEYIERKNNISSKRRNEFQYRPDYDVKIDNSNGEVIDVDYDAYKYIIPIS